MSYNHYKARATLTPFLFVMNKVFAKSIETPKHLRGKLEQGVYIPSQYEKDYEEYCKTHPLKEKYIHPLIRVGLVVASYNIVLLMVIPLYDILPDGLFVPVVTVIVIFAFIIFAGIIMYRDAKKIKKRRNEFEDTYF